MNELYADHIRAILATLPNLPGVYKMLGVEGELLYVGKAKNLKNRVTTYFAKTVEHPKTRALVARIRNIETLITRSETEALLLEQNLIKENKPPYNIMLRDDKSYLYIFISADQPYPRLAAGRGKRNHQEGKFFGPYPSAAAAREVLVVMQKMFMVRSCENAFFAQRKRPCLEYQIKRCRAPCVGLVSPEDYAVDVANTIDFMKGNMSDLNQKLISQMEHAAEELDFEQAALYRDQLGVLREVQAHQSVYTVKGEADILAIAQQAGVVCVQVMNVRGGRVLGGKSFFPDLDMNDNIGELLSEFLASFYFQFADELPSELIVNVELPDKAALEEALQLEFKQKVTIKSRVRENRAEWLEIANMNADGALKAKLANHIQLKERFRVLQDALGQPIDRIECFDISHTMGESPIASCVVFDQGGARKRDYRQYAITDITGGDDYAAMAQVLERRYKKQPIPDLMLIDGGKGQLNVAKAVMEKLDLHPLMIGVSKGEGRKPGLETLHRVDGTFFQLEPDDKALHLIQQIRDEAHRFAITKHRAKRDKKRGGSVLEVIPGLGPKRRRDLLTHFGGIQGVLRASENELAGVAGFGASLARVVYKVLHE
ncbi:excinuclease ABC subunit UvrC [Aquirhabdus parva]|uniref:UvrABC system protein C n=1 Tax=Aquirhabdus parva TaxID=2283318 RepID=A0A345PBV3_9GAMM|nr:excinuclease ABC subunit UvrC [Aquirhabdus parva]AXI04762.1 excinuclease ABC subunit UvrC [Aquirhabdus parva]